MKAKTSQKRIYRLNRIILLSALLFIVLSFIGFYMSISEIEMIYLNFTKGLLVVDLVFMLVCNEVVKEEKNRYKYSHQYTFMVNRR